MLSVNGLHKTYQMPKGAAFQAVKDVSFDIPRGAFFTLLGPSGCGKTTTLRSIAGLERPDSGSIIIGEHHVFDGERGVHVPPNRRQIGMVFQSYAIWPHMNVFENVAFPLRVGMRLPREEISRRVQNVLQIVMLANLSDRPATKLSGGQQQRLALARALVVEPDLLLLDEPLSNLDAKLRESMRFELRRLQKEVGVTTVFVTHDQSEALTLSDEIAVMNDGEIVQVGTPRAIYNRPGDRFVATFIGSTNLLSGRVAGPSVGVRGVIDTDVGPLRCVFSEHLRQAANAVVSVRPESIAIASPGAAIIDNCNVLTGRIRDEIYVGEATDYVVMVGDVEIRVRAQRTNAPSVGAEIILQIRSEECFALPG